MFQPSSQTFQRSGSPLLHPGVRQEADNPFAPNLSGADLSSHLGLVTGAGLIYVDFFYAKVQVQDGDQVPTWQDRLCVAKAVKGDRLTISTSLITPEAAAMLHPAEWAAFNTSGDSRPSYGTPLQELPGITQSQLAILALYRLRSIEDLVQVGRDNAVSIGLEATAAYDLAKGWMDRANEGAALREAAERRAEADAHAARLEQQVAELTASNAAMAKQMEAFLARFGGTEAPASPLGLMPPGVHAPAPAAPGSPVIAVEGAPINVRTDTIDAFDVSGGGQVTGNDDLGGSDLPPPPVAAPARKAKG